MMLWSVSAEMAENRCNDRVAGIEAAFVKDRQEQERTQLEVTNVLQEKLDALTRSRSNARRVQQRCVSPTNSPAVGRDAAPGSGEHVRPDAGVTTDALLDYAAEAERYRLQLTACQALLGQGG
jgi:hypothetical protein